MGDKKKQKRLNKAMKERKKAGKKKKSRSDEFDDGMVKVDVELSAMRQCAAIMEGISPKAQDAVLEYLYNRYHDYDK